MTDQSSRGTNDAPAQAGAGPQVSHMNALNGDGFMRVIKKESEPSGADFTLEQFRQVPPGSSSTNLEPRGDQQGQAETSELFRNNWSEVEVSTGPRSLAVGDISLLSAVGDIGTRHKYQRRAKKKAISNGGHRSPRIPDDESSTGSDSSDSESEFEDSEEEEPEQPKATAGDVLGSSSQKPRRSPAKDAREYMARLNEADEGCQSKKRTANSDISGRNKKAKTCQGGQEMGVLKRLRKQAAENPAKLNTAAAPAMPAIHATTHKEQIALMKNNIPPNADNRRTSTQAKDLMEAVQLFGYKKVEAVDGEWRYKRMNTTLFDYQITASAWMIKRELGRFKPHGGVLADDMGMGKTLMALTCIAGNPADHNDITMFSKETVKHCCKKFLGTRVSVYDPKEKNPLGKRKKMMIVITTYGELMRQYPKDDVIEKLRKKYEGKESSYERALARKMGFLFKHKWYRVILDEAHTIKNVTSQTAKVCCALKSKHNWALTGTPLANSAQEFFSYLKFIRCHYTECPATFKQNYTSAGKANDWFETLVSMVMYRRTLNDTFMAHRMINLPGANGQEICVPLSREEETIQEVIIRDYEEKMGRLEEPLESNDIKKRRDKMRGLHLTLMTRLREAASHAFNLENMFRNDIEVPNIQSLTASLASISSKKSVLEQMLSNDDGTNCLEGFEGGVARLRELKLRGSAFGGEFEMGRLLEMMENERRARDRPCSACQAAPLLKAVRFDPCGHYYCMSCYFNVSKPYLLKGGTAQQGSTPELRCSRADCGQRVVDQHELITLDSIGDPPSKLRDKTSQAMGSDSNGVSPPRAAGENGFFLASASLPECPTPPSAKLTAAMAVICTWQRECPEDKIIVFFQFIMTGKVLGRMLESAGISFLYFTGAMSQQQKNKALADFEDDPEKKILISGMKCGGQALNLTVANRVIIIDPWWNLTAEQQAFSRVRRYGQKKIAHLVRIKATNARIEARISELQKSKDIEISHALQDDGHVPAMLCDEELKEMLDGEPRKRAAKRKSGAVKVPKGKNAATRRR